MHTSPSSKLRLQYQDQEVLFSSMSILFFFFYSVILLLPTSVMQLFSVFPLYIFNKLCEGERLVNFQILCADSESSDGGRWLPPHPVCSYSL